MANKYNTVINTESVLNYLRIDKLECDSLTINEIENMINSAVSLLQKYTGHYIQPIEQTFVFNNQGEIRCYDFPINSVTEPTDPNDYNAVRKTLYTIYQAYDAELETMVINVGYENPQDVPSEFLLAVNECVRVWYYNTEDNNGVGLLPNTVYSMVNDIKRFIF